jgi:hypothetical protein
MAQNRNADRILVGNPEGKRPLGRHRCTWQNKIKMDFREIGWGGVAQDKDQRRTLVNTAMNHLVP